MKNKWKLLLTMPIIATPLITSSCLLKIPEEYKFAIDYSKHNYLADKKPYYEIDQNCSKEEIQLCKEIKNSTLLRIFNKQMKVFWLPRNISSDNLKNIEYDRATEIIRYYLEDTPFYFKIVQMQNAIYKPFNTSWYYKKAENGIDKIKISQKEYENGKNDPKIAANYFTEKHIATELIKSDFDKELPLNYVDPYYFKKFLNDLAKMNKAPFKERYINLLKSFKKFNVKMSIDAKQGMWYGFPVLQCFYGASDGYVSYTNEDYKIFTKDLTKNKEQLDKYIEDYIKSPEAFFKKPEIVSILDTRQAVKKNIKKYINYKTTEETVADTITKILFYSDQSQKIQLNMAYDTQADSNSKTRLVYYLEVFENGKWTAYDVINDLLSITENTTDITSYEKLPVNWEFTMDIPKNEWGNQSGSFKSVDAKLRNQYFVSTPITGLDTKRYLANYEETRAALKRFEQLSHVKK